MPTRILNAEECGYKEFMMIGPNLWGFGGSKGNQKLHIMRVIVVDEHTKVAGHSLFGKPNYNWDVDLDIYLEDGTKIETHSTNEKFIRRMMTYCWELNKQRPHVNFYGQQEEKREELTKADRENLVIMTQQLESEKLILNYLIQERDKILATHRWESYEVQVKQKKVLAAEKRIWNLQQRIDRLHAKAVR